MKKLALIYTIMLISTIIIPIGNVESANNEQKNFNKIIINKNVKIESSERDFHDYDTLTSELQDISLNYPDITNLYNLGESVQGRTLWGLKITDNPDIEENEPEVRICGAHHGNEYMSVELPLMLAWLLVQNYSIDPYITDLINNREIWIIPLVNPDGREAGSRYNANGVDLNRDYGYIWGQYSQPFSQPETQIMRENALDNNFVLSLSFHTSGDIVNYVWNHKTQPVQDNAIVAYLSEQYGLHNDYWVVEGYDWYQTTGDTNDFSYGCRGDIDTTIEVQNSDINGAWDLNRDAMIEIIDAADIGVHGIVTDSITGLPIAATVWVEEAYWPCFTDPKIGDYHKLVMPGSYTFNFKANGYLEKTFYVDVVDMDTPVILNVQLDPDNEEYYAYQVTSCKFYDPYGYPDNYENNPSEAVFALGPPDGKNASLGEGGQIVLDLGENGEIINVEGNDFTVFEGDDVPDEYSVEISQNWSGPWTLIGNGIGTTDFDINNTGLTNARYIRIKDIYDGDPYAEFPGFDLDAVKINNNQDYFYVDDDFTSSTPGWSTTHFDKIQDGINTVPENGTVFVYDGLYYENIEINKSITLVGEDRELSIIDGIGNGDVISLQADNISIKGFTIRNSGSNDFPDWDSGISADGALNNILIYDNIIRDDNIGIYIPGFTNKSHINISSNQLINNTDYAMYLQDLHYSIISYNTLDENNDGILLSYHSENNEIIGNKISNQNSYGLYLKDIDNNIISNNDIISNLGGIYLFSLSEFCTGNIISDNFIDNAMYCGLIMQFCQNNTIFDNTIKNNIYGIYLNYSGNNLFYHNNLIDNNQGVYDENINNWYNSTIQEGNYWSDFDESIEGAYDNNTDGIVDNPYNIPNGSNLDLYPLIYPISFIDFFPGWNLICLTRDTNIVMSSSLAENVSSCISVNSWDSVNQTYRPYIVGGPPDFDFPVSPGIGLFVSVNKSNVLSLTGTPPLDVSIDLFMGWNLLGWYHDSDTMASSIAENISGCVSVNAWDSAAQTYSPYIVGGPPDFDYVVTPGMGLFVYVSEGSIWNGEG